MNELRPIAERAAAEAADEHATFFEFMSAMAFLQFARQSVDVAIIEVGMGGRLDATNVVEPDITVITSIGLDHIAELGGTFALIAREKAGIIKPGVPVVTQSQALEATQAIEKVATDLAAPFTQLGRHWRWTPGATGIGLATGAWQRPSRGTAM